MVKCVQKFHRLWLSQARFHGLLFFFIFGDHNLLFSDRCYKNKKLAENNEVYCLNTQVQSLAI